MNYISSFIKGTYFSGVFWKVATKELRIGKDVTLECRSSRHLSVNSATHAIWVKRYPSGLFERLASIDTSYYPEKYEAKLYDRKNGMKYTLRIKDFNFNDVHFTYRCELHFGHYDGQIILADDKFVCK